MAFKCRSCGSQEFRISHLRSTDLHWLLLMQWPVRCRVCGARIFVTWFSAWQIRRTQRHRRVMA